jgi:cell division septum initiation protein DivIVA
MEILKSLLCGAVGAAIVAGLFSLLGKKVDHSHEDKKEKMAENKELQKRVQKLTDAVASINALLLHNMTGNATGKMAKAQEELTTYIIEHGGE